MQATHILGLLLGLGTLTVGAAAGCGSSNTSGFDDPNASSGGLDGSGPIFGGGDAGEGSAACQGLQCQQKSCGGGGDTTVTGTVFAPNGTLPLYNAIVYVPNTTPDALTKGATCDKCGAVTGNPVVSAISDSSGKFTLKNVPVGKDIPLVIQIGKWRRQVTIPTVAECTETKLTDPELTRLPKKQSEGDMPQIALTTGGCDKLGCMLPKVGIDPSEFGVESDGPSKAVHTYLGSGAPGAPAGAPPGAPSATSLWSDLSKLMKYDLTIFSCECEEHLDNKGGGNTGAPFTVVSDYMKAGGRIFTTDFMYTWYRYAGDAQLKSAASWRGGAPPAGSPMSFDSTFPKGQALVDWLDVVGATPTKGQLKPDVVWGNVISLDANKTQAWAQSGAPNAAERVFTVNVPVGVPAAQQCGKGVHIDAHLNQLPPDNVDNSYPAGCNSKMKPGENLLAFFFFDLASCIQNDGQPPAPPPVVK
jgi:hypothetical protein